MKLLVFSDSHGDKYNMEKAVKREKPDEIVFLGDGWADFEYIKNTVAPGTPTLQVKGNCDIGTDYLLSFVEEIAGKRVFITHGTREHVKEDRNALAETALMNECEIALYGHTHYQCREEKYGVTLVNPGSIDNGDYAALIFEDGLTEVNLKSVWLK